KKAGYKPGTDLSIAIDSAANSFSPNLDGNYDLSWSGLGKMKTSDLIKKSAEWLEKYPIILWEDPVSEGDWDGYISFTKLFGDKIEVVGDDNFVTNTKYIKKGIEIGARNSALIKLNQIGSVTETIEAVRMCKEAGWRYFLSHRSGETEDNTIADLAVALNCGQIKTGSASRSDRMAK
ncbi:enolase, partial [Rhodobacteraceae bacterium B1Z28]|nr:enolase [Ruegeria haliotis]